MLYATIQSFISIFVKSDQVVAILSTKPETESDKPDVELLNVSNSTPELFL